MVQVVQDAAGDGLPEFTLKLHIRQARGILGVGKKSSLDQYRRLRSSIQHGETPVVRADTMTGIQ